MKDIVLAITPASGALYAECFIRKISAYPTVNLTIVISDLARETFKHEVGTDIDDTAKSKNSTVKAFFSRGESQEGFVNIVSDMDFSVKYCSGSCAADAMVIMPCDMGTVGEIASGTTISTISKIAEIQLKEKKKLIIVPRESPYSLIHLRNLTVLSESGAIIAPASPAFYNTPSDIEELVESFVGRILEMASIARLNDKFKKLI